MSFLEKVDYPESATKEYSKKFLQFIFLKTLGATLFASSVFILLSLLPHTLKVTLASATLTMERSPTFLE